MSLGPVPPAQPRELAARQRADAVLTMLRMSGAPLAVDSILRWLASRTGATVGLFTADRAVRVAGARPKDVGALNHFSALVRDLQERGAAAAVSRSGLTTVHLVALPAAIEADEGTPDSDPAAPAYLVVVNPRRPLVAESLADAAHVLGLSWRLELAQQSHAAAERAQTHCGVAAFRLLEAGDIEDARRVAAALGWETPDVMRVCLVEAGCGGSARIGRALRHTTWVLADPQRTDRVIVLAAAEPDDDPSGQPVDQVEDVVMRAAPGALVGISEPLPVARVGDGLLQARHALDVARGSHSRRHRYDRPQEVQALLGPAGRAWAWRLMAPCMALKPSRRAGPDGLTLLGTLNVWLTLETLAGPALAIHRNTLAGRLRTVQACLGLDLGRLADRSTAWLALRMLDVPVGTAAIAPPPPPVRRQPVFAFDALFDVDAILPWARFRLRRVCDPQHAAEFETLRAWLYADARIAGAAERLGISESATRKRLIRAEGRLDCFLLRPPSAKHELWLAMRALSASRRAD